MVTWMDWAPADSGGETAAICVGESTSKLEAGTVPKRTLVAPERLLPVMVTGVPPVVGPVLGETPVTFGALGALW